MFILIKSLVSVLNKKQKNKLFLLQFMVVFSALLEVVSVLAIGPFMAIVGNPSLLETNTLLNSIYIWFGFQSGYEFLVYTGFGVLSFMLVSAFLSVMTIRLLSFFAADVGSGFGNRLYQFYMEKDYLYHLSVNSSELIKKISVESNRVTDNILQPLVQINARIATIIFISVFVFLYNPYVALVGVLILFLAYYAMYRIVRNRLFFNGEAISVFSRKRFSLMNEGFGSIKELKILGRQKYFIDQFSESGDIFARAYGSSNSLYNMPRYIMEFVVYSSMVSLILVLLMAYDGDLASVLPVMAVFGMAAFKLLPSFQQVYSGLAQIRSNITAFDTIYEDLLAGLKNEDAFIDEQSETLTGDVCLKNITFKYPAAISNALNNINLVIPHNKTVGIVGPSGSGKSTLFDVLTGIIPPDSGVVTVGGVVVDKSNLRSWQNGIGYVSQMTLIRDGTIAENIAFGINPECINSAKLISAAEMANLDVWLKSLPDGLNTMVGERGVQISGGQRQRIAIARALYHDANYLFFDEATSALDSMTEKSVVDAIEYMSGEKTIVMIAHRINTVKNCSIIYVVEDGAIKDSGAYDELIARSSIFANMAGVSHE